MSDTSSIGIGIEDFGPMREDNNKVTEEAVQRIQAQAKQQKQIAQQIKKDKAINNQLAKFLTLLMQKIENEELFKAIVSTFFKTTDQRNQITYLRKDINIYVIVGFFIPFFQKEAEELKITTFYEKLGYKTAGNNLEKYILYLGKVSEVYHDNIPIDQGPLITLIILIAQTWILKDNHQDYDALRQNTLEILYGSYSNKK